jgi:hypothetical protein
VAAATAKLVPGIQVNERMRMPIVYAAIGAVPKRPITAK